MLKENANDNAETLIKKLSQRNIGTRPFFWPMHEQPVFRKMGFFNGESYPNAEFLARNGFYIPSGLALTNKQIETVSQILHEVM